MRAQAERVPVHQCRAGTEHWSCSWDHGWGECDEEKQTEDSKHCSSHHQDWSDRQAAAITSAFVQDLIAAEVLSVGSEYLAVDPKKIHRAREEVMRKVQSREKREILEGDVMSILIDSRITKTKVWELYPETKKFYTSTQKKDIYTMTDADGRFLDQEKVPDSTMSSS